MPIQPSPTLIESTPASPFPKPGIYVHWPFCARKCPYCDFYTFGAEHPQFSKSDLYLRALLDEIESLPDRFHLSAKPEADTIYFGGGTPSLIEPRQLEQILAALRRNFIITPDAEITMEVNPTAAESDRLAPARDLGVNRLSVGCQSFDDKFLRLLGRDHDAATARRVIGVIQSLGFENFSLDLMFSLPGQTLDDVRRDLDAVLAFAPAHISAYGLTLHEGTPFKRWNEEGRWTMPESDLQAEQFEMMMDRLAADGWEQYEISNWSRPGRRSRHNSKYWSPADVYAFGVSAHGAFRGRRYSNPRDLAAYLAPGHSITNLAPPPGDAISEFSPSPSPSPLLTSHFTLHTSPSPSPFPPPSLSGNDVHAVHNVHSVHPVHPPSPFTLHTSHFSLHSSPFFESPPSSPRARLGEIMMLALRRTDGVAWTELDAWAGTWHPGSAPEGLRGFYRAELARLTRDGLLTEDESHVRLTRRGILLGDDVMLVFF